MPQDRESGAAGRDYGLRMARGLAKLMGAERLSQTSNEVRWNGKRAVIKSCSPANDSFGVTAAMPPRLDVILAGFEDDQGEVQVWELDARKFETAMRDSRSSGAIGGRVKLVRKRFALTEGRPVARFPKGVIEVAAG